MSVTERRVRLALLGHTLELICKAVKVALKTSRKDVCGPPLLPCVLSPSCNTDQPSYRTLEEP